MIAGHIVEFHTKYITVYGCEFNKKDLEVIYQVLKMEQIRSLNVGCNGQFKVDIELITKILDRLK